MAAVVFKKGRSYFRTAPRANSATRSRRSEAQIRDLDSRVQRTQDSSGNRPGQDNPRLRSTALPHGAVPRSHSGRQSPAPASGEEADLLRCGPEPAEGARGGGGGAWETFQRAGGAEGRPACAAGCRIRSHFRGPSTTNPKLVNYLAAGGIQGLRPLRYEKRVARNRFVALVLFLFVILLESSWRLSGIIDAAGGRTPRHCLRDAAFGSDIFPRKHHIPGIEAEQ